MQIHRAPQIPRRHRAERRPALAEFRQRAHGRHAAQSVGQAKAVAYAEVVDRKYVWPTEAEHEQHLHGPASYAADLRDALDDLFALERVQNLVRWNQAREGLGGEILDAGNLR